ncbi:MAG: InlB B-repeat-containing protein, partial [Bacteroidaceae bacterium]|nr:InlB B-repeat-containing protein [Bacteroidaceae bacterium]
WEDVPASMPAHDLTIVAKLTINRYRLSYVVDGEEIYADSVAYKSALTAIEEPTKEGHTFSGWSELLEVMPAGDVTVTGSFTANKYLLVYLLDDKTHSVDSIAYGTPLVQKEALSKEGHTFSGWSELPEVMPAEDVTVTGSFTVNKYLLVYLLDGAEYSVDSIAYGTTLVQKEALSKEGYTFSGWSELPATMPAEDVMVTGSFTINKYLLAFVLDGDTIVTDSVTYGMNFTTPEIPAKEGYTFSGWGEVPEVMPAEDVILIGEYRLNENQTDVQGLTYRLNDARDAFVVSGYTADLVADVNVPETLYGLSVNAVQDKALYGAVGLETIIVPASVSQVGTQVFGGCYGLLVLEWDATVSLRAECFDEAEAYGNMLVFTASATDFAGNVVVNGVAEEITLMDGNPFRNPKAFTAKRISYSREFTKKTRIGIAGGWEGLVLPFDVQRIVSKEKGEVQPFGMERANAGLSCWIAEMQEDATFGLVDKISANRPFIMEVPNSDEYKEEFNIEGIVIFTSDDATVYATEVQSATSENGYLFTGAYKSVGATPYVYALNDEEYTGTDGSVFLPGGAFVSDLRDVRPFEAYLYNEQLTRMCYLSINGGMATGIDRILKEENKLVDVYTLQGVMVKRQIPIETLAQELPGGIYIVNGKKMVIR